MVYLFVVLILYDSIVVKQMNFEFEFLLLLYFIYASNPKIFSFCPTEF